MSAHRTYYWALRLGIALVVIAALVLTAARIAMYQLPAMRGWLEAQAGERLGMAVEVGELGARLVGLTPEVTLSDLRLEDAGKRLRVARLRVEVQPLRSLFAGALRLARVELIGARVVIERRRTPALPPPGLLPDRLVVKGAEVAYRPAGQADGLRITGIDAALTRRGEALRLRAIGHASFAPGDAIEIAADLSDWRDGRPDGRVYLHAAQLMPAALARNAPVLARAPVTAGASDLSAWLYLDGGRPSALRGQLTAARPSFHGRPMARRLSGRFAWRRGENGWRIDADRLRLTALGGETTELAGLTVARDAAGVRVAGGGVDAVALAKLARASGRLPQRFSRWMAAAAPSGELKRFAAAFADAERWRARGLLVDGAAETYGRLPAVNGLEARFELTPAAGRVRLSAGHGRLELPELFRGPLPFAGLNGRVGWRREGRAWRISSPAWRVRNADGALTGRLDLRLDDTGPVIDLRAKLTDADGGATSRYLPAGIMPDELVAWLDRAILAGRIPRAELRLSGPLRRFPFRDGGGVFEVRADVREGRVALWPQWPVVENAAAHLRFHGAAMRIEAKAGRIPGASLRSATVEIADLEDAVVRLQGGFTGSGAALLRLLRRAPRGGDSSILERLRLEGEHGVSLEASIPFDGTPPRVSGQVDLNDASLALSDTPWRVDQLNGTVQFDSAGLSWNGLQGRFAGRKLLSRAWTEGGAGEKRITVNTRFAAGAKALGGDALPEAPIAGRADWLLTVNAPGFADSGDTRYRLRLDSDLRGLAVNAPAPFGKPKAAARPLALEWTIDDGEAQPWRLAYGDDVHARGTLDPAERRIERVALHFGAEYPAVPQTDGLVVTGRLPALPKVPINASASPTAALPVLRRVDLSVDELQRGGLMMRDLSIVAERRDGGWQAQLSGPASGEISLDGAGAVRVDLARLELQRSPKADAAAPMAALRPAELPPMDVRVASLMLDGKPWGSVELEADAGDDGWRLERLRLAGEDFSLEASGSWGQRVTCRFRAQVQDAGRVLARLGLGTSVNSGTGDIHGRLRWQGSPFAPMLDSLSGRFGFSLQDGSLPAVEPGAGRVFGLLSPALVPRRLLLDFSDVTSKGLAFDTFDGQFQVANGVARPERFQLDGPAARIQVSGPVDIAARTLDQVITVSPRVSTALPVIGGLAGGPPAALVLLLAQQLFGRELDAVGEFRYRVEGSWDDPRFHALERSGSSDARGGNG